MIYPGYGKDIIDYREPFRLPNINFVLDYRSGGYRSLVLNRLQMNRFKLLATIASLLTFVNGFFFMALPLVSLSLLGQETNAVGILNTQIAGACALGFGSVLWISRNTSSREVQRMVCTASLFTFGFLILIDLRGVLTKSVNQVGWLILAADLVLFSGFVSLLFAYRGQPN